MEPIQIGDHWYIAANSAGVDDRTRVLKSDDSFAVFSRPGEIQTIGFGEQGLYFLGTRHLSRWQIRLEGREPVLLNSTIQLDNSRLVVDQTTSDLHLDNGLSVPAGSLHLNRELATHESTLTERLTLVNYHPEPRSIRLEYRFGADFADVFQVRGVQRTEHGKSEKPQRTDRTVVLTYHGLDGVTRRTRIAFSQSPELFEGDRACFTPRLKAGDQFNLEVTVACASGQPYFCVASHDVTLDSIGRKLAAVETAWARVNTDNEQFNDWLNRSSADLQMLITHTRYGLYPYAGVPWFSTPFGRDGLITALQTLWVQPAIAEGVLNFLAATQASETDPTVEAEPGKILHELREGEMAARGEVPFRRYYGSVDATPLFVMLAGRYYQRTGRAALIQNVWPAIAAAMGWLEERMGVDGLLTYARSGNQGLVHQGWKDSDAAIFHRDGHIPPPPIALCEVQGYAYAAFHNGANLAERLGYWDPAKRWRARAERLREVVEASFWQEELETYAMAVDGDGQPCAIRSSNAGHLLFTGLATRERAQRVAATLLDPASYNGWGVRTVAAGEPGYNPMSYHNGSVWPHDTALIAAGLSRYGLQDASLTLLEGLFNASILIDLHRLPELVCGFPRRQGQSPTRYPVACSPQAWASGAVFLMVEAMLGLHFEAASPHIRLRHPRLPAYLGWLEVKGLHYGDAEIDLVVRRHGSDVSVTVERRRGELDVSVIH